MEKFEFLLGVWNLHYSVPQSKFSHATTGTGTGMINRVLDNKYVTFDYESLIDGQKGQAHAIFAWDEKNNIYRYWWFESSGSFQQATCNFVDDDTLCLNWHDTLLVQAFKKIASDSIILTMQQPNSRGGFATVLEVTMTRR
jgi:hypothetical protein